jgi:undecaprenyl-diphosphatase
MIEFLNNLDTRLFIFLNSHHNNFWDIFFYCVSYKYTWIPLYLGILYFLTVKYKKQTWILLLAVVVLIVLSDQIASGIIKNAVERLRPSHNPALANIVHMVKGYRGGPYGFVSSHASNTFAIAVFTTLIFQNRLYGCCILIWAAVVSYSRIYLGVHYPGDVLGGAIIGISCGIFVYYITLKVLEARKIKKDTAPNKT